MFGAHWLPPGAGIASRTARSTERRRVVRPGASPSSGQAGPRDTDELAGPCECDGPGGLAAVGRDREHRIHAHPPEQRHVGLAREPLDLGVIVRAVGHDPELATHPLAAEHGREPEHVRERLEGGSDNAQDDVGLVDELAVAVLQDATQVRHQQVIPGALGALEQRIGFDGTEDPRARVGCPSRSVSWGWGGRVRTSTAHRVP